MSVSCGSRLRGTAFGEENGLWAAYWGGAMSRQKGHGTAAGPGRSKMPSREKKLVVESTWARQDKGGLSLFLEQSRPLLGLWESLEF